MADGSCPEYLSEARRSGKVSCLAPDGSEIRKRLPRPGDLLLGARKSLPSGSRRSGEGRGGHGSSARFLVRARQGNRESHGLSGSAVRPGDRQIYASPLQVLQQVCKAEEWPSYEPKLLKAIERATKIDQLEIFSFRKEFDKAVEVLPKLLYPNPEYGDDRLFMMITKP